MSFGLLVSGMNCIPAVKGQPEVADKGSDKGKAKTVGDDSKGGEKGKAKAADEEVKVDKGGGPEGKKKGIDEELHSGARKKRKKSVFNTSPRDYNADIFKANNPFVVAVVETSTHSQIFPKNKVADGQKMDKRALLAAIRAVVKSTALSSW